MSHLSPNLHQSQPQKFWQKKSVQFTTVGLVILLFGMAIGAAGEPEPVTVTKEVPGPERVVTKTVEKEVTPQACLTALDLSEEGFGYAGEAIGYLGDALTAAGNIDVAALQEANAGLETVSPKMKQLTTPIKENSAKCRAAAK